MHPTPPAFTLPGRVWFISGVDGAIVEATPTAWICRSAYYHLEVETSEYDGVLLDPEQCYLTREWAEAASGGGE